MAKRIRMSIAEAEKKHYIKPTRGQQPDLTEFINEIEQAAKSNEVIYVELESGDKPATYKKRYKDAATHTNHVVKFTSYKEDGSLRGIVVHLYKKSLLTGENAPKKRGRKPKQAPAAEGIAIKEAGTA